jgi:predicted RNA-binding protein Jag
MTHFLRSVFVSQEPAPGQEEAMREVELAVHKVLEQQHPVELTPQNTYVRRLQHQFATGYGLTTESTGTDPYRRVVIYPA